MPASVREGTTTAILMTPPRGHKPFVFTGGKQVTDKRNEEVNAAEHAKAQKEEEQAEEEGGDEDDTKRYGKQT